MKQVQKNLNSLFKDLIFEPVRHTYFRQGRYLPAVSNKVKEYVPEFDEAYWLPRCAKKEKVTEHELKHRWQTINTTACELGTRVHIFLENYTGLQTPSLPQEIAGIKFLKAIAGKYSILARELRGYSLKYGFAGTMDMPLLNLQTGKIVIADWKTNGDLFKSYGYMLPPFRQYENMPYNHYQVQLSLYRGILVEAGFEVEDTWIVHLKADAEFKVYSTYNFLRELSTDMTSKQKIAA